MISSHFWLDSAIDRIQTNQGLDVKSSENVKHEQIELKLKYLM